MKLKEYITEAIDKDKMHDKLLKRYQKTTPKLERARNIIMDVNDEMEKIQTIMKRHGIESLTNDKGYSIFDADGEISVWDRMS
jgi:hypothetical protein